MSYAVIVGKEQAALAVHLSSAPSTQKAAAETAPSQQDSQSTSARGKKRKATGEAEGDAIDLEYVEVEDEADNLPTEVIDDDADLS